MHMYFMILGCILADFLCLVLVRRKRKESFILGRSHCDRCGHELGPVDLIPIAGWFLRGGRCAWCANPIPAVYPLAELTGAAAGSLFWLWIQGKVFRQQWFFWYNS